VGLVDRSELVAAYFAYQATHAPDLEWAWEAVDLSGFDNAEDKWGTLLALLAGAPDDWQIGLLAAGPLEDFIRLYGASHASVIRSEADHNERLRNALPMTWPRRVETHGHDL